MPTAGELRAISASVADAGRLYLHDPAAPRMRWLQQVGIVLVCVGLAVAVRWFAGLFAPDVISYSTFLPAVAIAALLAGGWAGLATLTLSLTVNLTVFGASLEAVRSPQAQIAGATLFVISGVALNAGRQRASQLAP